MCCEEARPYRCCQPYGDGPRTGLQVPSLGAIGVAQAQLLVKQNRTAEAVEPAVRDLRIATSLGRLDQRLASTYLFLGTLHRDQGHCAEARTT